MLCNQGESGFFIQNEKILCDACEYDHRPSYKVPHLSDDKLHRFLLLGYEPVVLVRLGLHV